MKTRCFTFLILCLVFLIGCSKDEPSSVWILQQEQAVTLADGTSVDLWRNDTFAFDSYRLSDGTELLIVQDPSGPQNVSVGNYDNYDDLSENVQNIISNYYDEQGLLYDILTELEKAYAEYQTNEDFDSRLVSQEIAPAYSNDRVMCFLTTVSLPLDSISNHEIQLSAIFDRETGDLIDIWELFAIPQAEVRKWIVDAYETDDATLQAEMAAAFKPEYITFNRDSLEVWYPAGSLPSQELTIGFGIPYTDLEGILHDWVL